MIVKTHDVFCDRCPNWAANASTTDSQGGATVARRAAASAGWVRRNGEDLCPECRARDDQRKKALKK
jgi:hypothetical protein